MSQAAYATVTAAAQSIGISHVKDSVASQIANEANRNILKILCDAVQIATTTHSKRLCTPHINLALESNGCQPLFGYLGKAPEAVNVGRREDLLAYKDRQLGAYAASTVYPVEPYFECEWTAVAGKTVREEEDQDDEVQNEQVDNSIIHVLQRQRIDGDTIMSSSKHVISGETQLFYQTVLKRLQAHANIEEIFSKLRTESCLGQLFPYFLKFAIQNMKKADGKYDNLYVTASIVMALAQNDDLLKSLETYSDQVISIALTLLVSPQIVARGLSQQFLIRDYGAILLGVVVNKMVQYTNVQSKITNQMVSVLLHKRTLSQKYGSIAVLKTFGLLTISGYGLSRFPQIVKEAETAKHQQPTSAKAQETSMRVYDECLECAGLCLHSDTYHLTATGIEFNAPTLKHEYYRETMDTFGSDLLPYVIDDSSLLFI